MLTIFLIVASLCLVAYFVLVPNYIQKIINKYEEGRGQGERARLGRVDNRREKEQDGEEEEVVYD